jgi:lipopolysaccharide export system ATP-binding protein
LRVASWAAEPQNKPVIFNNVSMDMMYRKSADLADRGVSALAKSLKRVNDEPIAELELRSISKSFRRHEVLRDLSITVHGGEIVGLLGPDGAGKTTCFEVIIGLQKPAWGQVLLNGTDITHLPTYRRAILGLSYLAQEPGVFRGLTVEQNIRAVLEISEPDAAARRTKLQDLLQEFHLEHLRDRKTTHLSGGERRRCEIVRALAADPCFMLLDEPFAGIDPITIEELERLIRGLRERQTGVLITDHNIHEMLHLVDRAYVIVDGQLVFDGMPEDLVADATVRKLYLGQDSDPGNRMSANSRA